MTIPFPAMTTEQAAEAFREALAEYDRSVAAVVGLVAAGARESEVRTAQAKSEEAALAVQSANADRIFALDCLVKSRAA